jgi:hypothetical protein
MATAELQSKMILWRQKCIDGTITKEDLTEAMKALRGERDSAATSTVAKRTARAKAAIPSAEDLLAELGMDEDKEEDK